MFELILGIVLLLCGIGHFYQWNRHRSFRDHKKLGYGFTAMGAFLILAYLMGWV
jgi:hypothetical protein